MQNEREPTWRTERGYALPITLLFLAIMLVFLASAVQWTSSSTALTARNSLHTSSVYAAEAATELVLSKMDYDFMNQSLNPTFSVYGVLVPSQAGWPIQFQFSDGRGAVDRTGIRALGIQVQTNLTSPFEGLYGILNIYEVTSAARPINSRFDPEATVSQLFELALIPVFQFAIFYNLDLEINPGQAMTVTGKVHGNAQIYAAPPASLRFNDLVTAVGLVNTNNRSPNDPTGGGRTAPIFDVGFKEKVGSLTLPIGANDNRPESTAQILDPPPPGEDPMSPTGKSRLHNHAMLIVSNSPSGNLTVTSGEWYNYFSIPPDVTNAVTGAKSYSFVANVSFYDYRERKQVQATQLDVGKLGTWIKNSGPAGGAGLETLAQVFGKNLDSVYVLNRQAGAGLPAVRVVNGATLPDSGLTVATARPIYVQGHYNLNNGDTTPGQANTSLTKPAALMGDSITILSGNWSDSYNSGMGLSGRNAVNTTVNAAFLTGIVESGRDSLGNPHYSGGVENLPRFLENWSGRTFTYNGSMVVMFPSRYATNYWQSTGIYYNPPARRWAFDLNFLDQNRLPPLAPSVRKLFREDWRIVASGGN